MRASLVLLHLLVCQALSAGAQDFPDQVAVRYASSDLAKGGSRKHTGYYLVKFREYPGESLHDYGVVKSFSQVHFILKKATFDSSLARRVVYVLQANDNWKASTNLLNLIAIRDSVELIVNAGAAPGYCRIIRRTGSNYIVSVLTAEWRNFIAQSIISFADVQRKAFPEQRINSADLSANAINTVQQAYPAIRGTDITVSLKEDLFDTTDLDLKGRFILTSQASANFSSHATIMATMIAGAGNNGEKGLGAAPQALLCPANYTYSLMPEDSAYMRDYKVSVQNHSYGTGIENYYGAEAVAYDEEVYHTDTVLHVFSSGNVGTSADTGSVYANLKGFANLTGTFKQAKNVLVVGASDDSLHVPGISSKGPAYDGRIKPELVAFGIDGSSGSAALTSGVSALLQQAYKQVYHSMPSAALVKAILINSANGNGISYSRGFGSLHALHAMQTLEQKRFLQGRDNGIFTIQVPAGVQRLKVTLAWNDPPAEANVSGALVNDLDVTVIAGGRQYLPWVLSSAPVLDSLSAAPHRSRDSLNNVEQITIDNPLAGEVQIIVAAHHLKVPNQAFYLAYGYEFKNSFEWQNPGSEEVMVAGNPVPVPLRWTSNVTAKGDLFCSYDKGTSWQRIATQLNTATGLFYWSIPDTFCAALLKYTTADTSFISDTFYLSPRPSLQIGYNCRDSAMIFWNSLSQAGAYELYHMGNTYLLPYTQTADTFLTISSATNSAYYAVSPLHTDGWTGLKSYATNYQLQGTGCYFKSLLATATDDGNVSLHLSLGTTYHLDHLYWERLSGNGYVTLDSGTVNTNTNYAYADENAKEGLLYYRVKLITTNGTVLYSDPASVYILRKHDYMLFPNPAAGTVTLLSKAVDNMQMQVFDMSGKLVLTRVIANLQESIPINGLVPGTYVCVLVNNGNKVFSQPLIKL
ncbi:S8 family peptidase [Chitinophaga sancti]|uniref:Por secretion system C-terminal sorting domain-containing protein n=1 Tax=Chitinophaga sancti TaxID=1004 RepID=A0A1K1LTW2_9BACT|nr:S8 family peptidase [Chitinophaga sancti]WQD64855.1 S8 family peptidase [Chitinophaga sancti]WQG89521.1 S8 family peptidase [Chitinophaga sancti]SFW14298.1 Por secretion system C-terminal sorting domain-containing protein [Chitinophaga sancti]